MGKQSGDSKNSYAAIVAEAEASVSAVKDPELRRVAFEKILSTLLESDPSKPSTRSHKGKEYRAAVKPGKKQKATHDAVRRGPKGHIEALIEDGFFIKPRTIAEVKAELANGGYHIAITSLSGPLQKLTQERQLRRQKATKSDSGSKSAFSYSNW